MSGIRVFRQDDFTGGLNLRADQFQLAENESPKMLNVEIDPRGGVFSRGAMRRINNSPITANWVPEVVAPFYGDSHFIMLSTGRDIVDGSVYYSTGGNFSQLAVDVSHEHGASFASWGNVLYMSTGVGSSSYKWDGTTLSSLSGSGPVWQNSYLSPTGGYFPRAKHAITHAGKIFVASTIEDGVQHKTRIRWSHPNSPENWAEQDYIDINDGGSEINALAVFAGHLVIFKHNAVFAVFGYDSDSFQVVEISRVVGAATSHSVVSTERGVYFFSYPDGLMLYNGQRVVDIFEPIRPAIQRGYINPAAIDEVYVSYINRRVWIGVPYSEVSNVPHPTLMFVYDPSITQRGAWLMFQTADQKGFSGGCTFVKEDGTSYGVVAHSSNPYVLKVDQYSNSYDVVDSSGVDYQFTSLYRSRWIDAGSYSSKKMWRRPDVVVKQMSSQGELNLKVFGDYEEAAGSEIKSYAIVVPAAGSGLTWGSGVWGSNWGAPNVGSQIMRGRSLGLVRAVQLEFSGPPGLQWGINSFTLKYNPRKVNK